MIISIKFLTVLTVSWLGYWLIPWQKGRLGFLSLNSLAYIAWNDRLAALLVLFMTLFIHFIGLVMVRSERKKVWHRFGVIGLLLILIGFKYLGLLARSVNDLLAFFQAGPLFSIDKILLPLGLSYIVFKLISYITDLYWGRIERGSLLEILFYGSLFTIFVAGPIERFKRLAPQIREKRAFSWEFIETGAMRISIGLFKKLVIADWIGYFIGPVWQNGDQYSALIRILALFGYSIQIYMDFAGYSDMAIGTSKLFGLNIMENFDWPYLRSNISDFWKSWHISLSEWIRDYIFIPLSSKRPGNVWLYVAVPLISMGLCGLWHGASWNFLFWGLWHGAGISILQIWLTYKRKHKQRFKFMNIAIFQYGSTLMTYIFVTIGWLFFL